MEDHQPALLVFFAGVGGARSACVGGLGEPQILLIMKKGYKQVNEKDY